MNIGEKIKIFRIEKGLTQKELANRLGKSIRTIQKYEKGDIVPTIDLLIEIGKVLNIELIDANTFNSKIRFDDSVISELISNLFESKEVDMFSLLPGDVNSICKSTKQHIISLLDIMREKNKIIVNRRD